MYTTHQKQQKQQQEKTILNLMNFTFTQQQQKQTELYSIEKQVQIINSEGKYEVFLKAAKGREDQYRGTFPSYLLCNPYKYDLKIKGTPIDENVIVELLDRETKENIEKKMGKKKKTVSVASIEKLGNRELVIRFSLNLCSFHYKKRDFLLKVTSKSTGKLLFISTPFHTYARKRRTNKKKEVGVKKRKFVSIKSEEEIIKNQYPVLKKSKYSPLPILSSPVKIISTIPQNISSSSTTTTTVSPSLNFEDILDFEEKNFANSNTPVELVKKSPLQITTTKRQVNYFSLDDLDENNDLFSNIDFDIMESSKTPQELSIIQDHLPKTPVPSFSPSISSPTLLPDFVVGNNNNTKGILEQLESQQRTSLAIQLMNQLSPSERQQVSMYMSCNNNPQHV